PTVLALCLPAARPLSAGSSFESALPALPAHTARVKQAARDIGREVRTLLNPMVICRETERETWAYHDAIVAHADPVGDFHKLDRDRKSTRLNSRHTRI